MRGSRSALSRNAFAAQSRAAPFSACRLRPRAAAWRFPVTPLISVILPTRDRPALLPRAVTSVLAQAGTDCELILVDNNARSPAVDLAHAGADWLADPRLRRVRAVHAATAAAARNAGLAAARGDWVAYLDDDDAYRVGKLSAQFAAARASGSPIVLCGAAYHLAGRTRNVQCDTAAWSGDDLLVRARWGTPLLLHRAVPELRFDATLATLEDLEFSLRLVRHFGLSRVPVVPEPLVDVYPQPGDRVNTTAATRPRAVARIVAGARPMFSRAARRRFLLQMRLAAAKLERRPGPVARLAWRLAWISRGEDWRMCANAWAVSLGVGRGRWVS